MSKVSKVFKVFKVSKVSKVFKVLFALMLTDSLSYPQPRDAIASKKKTKLQEIPFYV